MKKTLILIACLLALGGSPVNAQTSGPGVIFVSVVESSYSFKAAITREDGKSEVLTFPGGFSEKNLTGNSQWYQKLISKFYQEGYALKSTFGGDRRTYLVFVKGQ